MGIILMMVIMLIVIVIVSILLALLQCKAEEKKQINLIKYLEDHKLPEFKYKGDKINFELKMDVITQEIEKEYFNFSYHRVTLYTLFANNNPVLSLWEMHGLNDKYMIVDNHDYDTNNLYEILRLYKKEYNRQWYINYDKNKVKKSKFYE